jgi:hypothetical protein
MGEDFALFCTSLSQFQQSVRYLRPPHPCACEAWNLIDPTTAEITQQPDHHNCFTFVSNILMNQKEILYYLLNIYLCTGYSAAIGWLI